MPYCTGSFGLSSERGSLLNTSTEAVTRLQGALSATQTAKDVIENLIAPHDYQDVAQLVMQAAEKLLQAATLLMQSDDQQALELVEQAEDLLDAMYEVIESDLNL